LDLKTVEGKSAVEFEAKPRLGGRAATEVLMLIVPFAAAKYAGEATEAGVMAERLSAAGQIDADAAKGVKWSEAFTESVNAMRRLARLPQTTERAHLVSLPRASVGVATTTAYRNTFFEAFPKLSDAVSDVHHAVPQQIRTLRPDLFSEMEIHSIQNLRGIPTGMERTLHPMITKEWNTFFRANPASSLTRNKLLEEATRIDQTYGHFFNPALF
jgi:hypothetical protein